MDILAVLLLRAILALWKSSELALEKNLEVFFDGSFSFEKQITSVVKASFFHLRAVGKLKAFCHLLTLRKWFMHLFHTALINSLYFGISQAALSSSACSECWAPTLDRAQSWLVHTGFLYIIELILRFYCLFFWIKRWLSLNGLAVSYPSDLLTKNTPNRTLRLADKLLLTETQSRLGLCDCCA